MSTVKIEHVNPNSGRSVAFDVMSGDEVKDTFVLRHGEFRLFNLSGGLMLHEVSIEALADRERKAREDAELEAEVARERKAKEEQERAEKVKADREAKKAEIEAKVSEEAGESKADDEFKQGSQWTPEEQANLAAHDRPPLALNKIDLARADPEIQPDPVV